MRPSLCRTSRFLRSPASSRSPSLIMSSTPFTEVGCIGRRAPCVFLLILCSCTCAMKELTRFCRRLELIYKSRHLWCLYLSFIIHQAKLSSFCHCDLCPDRHPATGVEPHKIPLDKSTVKAPCATIWTFRILYEDMTEIFNLTSLKCSMT